MDFETATLNTAFTTPNWTHSGGSPWAPTGNLAQTVVANPSKVGNNSNQVLRLTGSGSGTRASQFGFNKASDYIEGYSKHGIAFDWYQNTATSMDWSYVGIQDNATGGIFGSSDTVSGMPNQFIAFYVQQSNGRLFYKLGNAPEGNDVNAAASLAGRVDTEIDLSLTKWYRFNIVIDTDAETIDFSITDLETKEIVFKETDLPFDSNVTYYPRIASIRFFAGRTSGSLTWNTFIDNLVLSRDTDIPTEGGDIFVNVSFATNQNIEVSGWVNRFSKSSFIDGKVNITIDNMDTADWYLNGAATPSFSGKIYELDLNPLLVGPNFLTVVVKRNGIEYSRKLDFTVTN
jgi:hypothetical protein